MTPPLTVRNLTSTPIRIKRVERFEDPNTLQSKSTGYFWGSRNNTTVTPTSPKLEEHAQSFNHEDVDIELNPYESFVLDNEFPESGGDLSIISQKAIRLTIESPGGERYRVDTNPSYTQKSSKLLTPLTSSSSTTYKALFHPTPPIPHLAIHSNHLISYEKWMQALPDALPLSAISIPGTHNSHTHYRALPSVRCQLNDVATQLAHGIRMLDIRVQPVYTDMSRKDLYLVHGAFPVSFTGQKQLEPILATCYAFLDANPSETILISLKREGTGSSTDAHLAQILEQHYISPNAAKWHTGTSIPYLGAVRGKLVLLRRYNLASSSSAYPGLDATAWPHNATSAMFPSSLAHPTFCLQDFCDVMNPGLIPEKVTHATEHLARAAAATHHIPGVNTDAKNPVPPGPLFLNFLSASNFFDVRCWPERIATVLNGGVERLVCARHHVAEEGVKGSVGELRKRKEGDGGTGVVVMDCVGDGGDWDLVELLVGMNMGVAMKVGEGNGVA